MRLRTQEGRLNLASLFGVVVAATVAAYTLFGVPIALVFGLATGRAPLPGIDGRFGPVADILIGAAAMPLSGALNGLTNAFAVTLGVLALRLAGRDVTVTEAPARPPASGA